MTIGGREPQPVPAPFRATDPRKARLIEKLGRLVGPGAAAFYRDACRILAFDPPLEATTHLIAHLLREIESALRDVLETIGGASARPTGPGEERHRQEITQILAALGVKEDDPISRAWLALAGRGEGALHGRAHRDALNAPRPANQTFRQWWSDMEGILDAVLERVETRFTTYKGVLDRLLSKAAPGSEDLKLLTERIPNSLAFSAYFFDRLKTPGWLRPLADAGVFDSPPPAIRDGNQIQFPPWPPARYLRRMAPLAPDEVMRTVAAIPATDNMAVHVELADIAGDIAGEAPPQMTGTWAEREGQWLDAQEWLYPGLAIKYAHVICRFAAHSMVADAIQLGRALLATTPAGFEPGSKCNAWEYEQVLARTLPALVEADGASALTFACDLLDRALSSGGTLGAPPTPPHAHSHVWRAAIEDHEQNLHLGLRSVLVSAVRDVAETLGSNAPERIPEIVDVLGERSKRWLVFRRVALHILRLHFDRAPTLAQAALTDHGLFDEVEVRHEYVLLLKERFHCLGDAEKATILGLIQAGPTSPDLRERLEAAMGRAVTDSDLERCGEQWQRDWLEPIAEALDGEWKSRYETLKSKTTQPEHAEFPVYTTGGAFGPTSPKTADDLAAMSPEDLAAYLRDWQPASGDPFHGPTPAGLATAVAAVISRQPAHYAGDLDPFKLPEPTYVRGVLSGFHSALQQNRTFDWAKVLEFCGWAAAQAGDGAGQRPTLGLLDRDADWTGTRRMVLILLDAGLKSKTCPISFDLSASLLAALKPLTEDPQPTPADEAQVLLAERQPGEGPKPDALTYAINTVRGQAIEAIVGYALWLRRHFETLPNAEELKAQGLGPMPGVAEILDGHLDPALDPSLAVRAIFGREFPRLHHLDPRWAEAAVPKIFSPDPALADHRAAAWGAYLASWPAQDAMWRVLRPIYREAVENIGNSRSGLAHLEEPERVLARHLMALYWRGKLDDVPSLLKTFYEMADTSLRAEAMNFVGWSLKQTDQAIPPEILGRLRRLWKERLQAARAADSRLFAEELVQFGWWFISGKFADEWAMDQLLAELNLTGAAQPDALVVARLAELSERLPGKAVACLGLMIAGDSRGMVVLGSRDEIRKIIANGLRSDEAGVVQSARDLADRLASLGYHDFVDLIPRRL